MSNTFNILINPAAAFYVTCEVSSIVHFLCIDITRKEDGTCNINFMLNQ